MKLKILCAVVIAAITLAGCSGNSTATVDIDPEETALMLVNESGLGDTSAMAPLTPNLVTSYYNLDEGISEYTIYVDGSGATAREVAVLKVADSGFIPDAREAVEARLKTLAREFENYQPGEMQKINSPVVEVKGNVLYMVVTDSPQKALSAIDSLYK